MQIKDGRGDHMVAAKLENRRRVYLFAMEHPGATLKEIADTLGLSAPTVRAHMTAIEAGWKPGVTNV